MKPANFPARKLARQIGAQIGVAAIVFGKFDENQKRLDAARNVRTKKRRS